MNWLIRRFQTWILSLVMPRVMAEMQATSQQSMDISGISTNIQQRFVQIENKLFADLTQFNGVRLLASQDLQQIHKELTGMNNAIAEMQERFRRYNEALGRSKNFAGMPRI